MKNGFDCEGFMEYLENTFSGFENSFLRETVDNIVNYGLEHEHVSLDQFCYWLSDMLPEVEFKEVAFFMDDSQLTKNGRVEKAKMLEQVEAEAFGSPWLDDLIKAAFEKKNAQITDMSKEKAKEILQNVMNKINKSRER